MDELKINEKFAKKYDSYRQAEELQKLKDKYGDADEDESSSSSSSESEVEDETAEAINSKLEKDFFHTLACIKKKDPVLYQKDETFFHQSSSDQSESDDGPRKSNAAKTKEKPFLLKDYERKVILERNGIYEKEDTDEVSGRNARGSYYAELDDIKRSLSEATKKYDKEFAEDEDGILKKKDSTHQVGNHDETTLEELDDYWKDPKLDEKEKFLRDYILDRKYLEEASEEEEESEQELEDERFSEEEEKFEYAYNTSREQPADHAFIKSYPRVIASSVRRKDERNKKRRQERKTRKEEERRKKIEELKRLKQLKRQEIVEKIERLKVATGNTDINFTNHDVNDEFDPTEHDKRMQELFNDEFYTEQEDKKPQFSDMEDDDFGEATDWNEQCNIDYDQEEEYDPELPDCEQADFVMDCDYQPEPKAKVKEKKVKGKDKKKKSEFYETAAKQNSCSDEKTMSEHLEEYYAMDFDDLIGDMPCRFKYRSVPANDYGLSTEDILLADDRTLNSWCSLKRVVQRRQPEEEDYLNRLYGLRARRKKDKHFEKFYKELEEKEKKSTQPQNETEQEETETSEEKLVEKHKKLNSRQRRRKRDRLRQLCMLGIEPGSDKSITSSKKKKQRKENLNETYKKISKLHSSRLEAYGLKPKKVLSKAKYGLNNKKTKKKNSHK